MSVHYRVYQNQSQKSSGYKKWYGRAVIMDTIGTDELASIIEANCTVKRADILAVLSELVVTMRQQLQESKRVKLDHLGAFKISMNTSKADTADKFDPRKNIKRLHVLFQPEVKVRNGVRVKSLLDGVSVAALPTYDEKKDAAKADDSQNG